jgi:hypothetical protein
MMKRKMYRLGLELVSKVDSLLRLPNLAFRAIDISGPPRSLREVRSKYLSQSSPEAKARVLVLGRQFPLKIREVVVDQSMVDLVGVRVGLGMGMEVSDWEDRIKGWKSVD